MLLPGSQTLDSQVCPGDTMIHPATGMNGPHRSGWLKQPESVADNLHKTIDGLFLIRDPG